jgi:Methylamine utilisation protein MauE
MERNHLREIIFSEWIYRILKVVYVILFSYAGTNKLLKPQAFATVIEAFGLVPDPLIMPIAVALPILEIVAAAGLLFNVRGSLGLVTGLLLFFIAVVSYGVWMGLDIDCGCFGPGDLEGEAYRGLRPALYRNLLLVIGIAYLYGWRFIRAVEPVRLGLLINRIRY